MKIATAELSLVLVSRNVMKKASPVLFVIVDLSLVDISVGVRDPRLANQVAFLPFSLIFFAAGKQQQSPACELAHSEAAHLGHHWSSALAALAYLEQSHAFHKRKSFPVSA